MKVSCKFISSNANPVYHPIAYFQKHPNIVAYCSDNQVYIHNSTTLRTCLSLNLNKQGIDPGRCNVVRTYQTTTQSYILAGYDSGHIVTFRCDKGQLEKFESWSVETLMKQENSVIGIEIEGDLVVTINNAAVCRIYRLEQGVPKEAFKLEFPLNKIPEAVSLVPYEAKQLFLFVGGIDQLIHVYSSNNKSLEFEYVNSLKGHQNAITRITSTTAQLSKDILVASSSRDGYIRVWKVVKEKDVPHFQKSVFKLTGDTFIYLESILIAHECSVTNLIWAPFNGLSLVSASMDCTLGVWSKDQTGVWQVRSRLGQLYGNKNAFFSILANAQLSYIMAINFTGASCVWLYNKENDSFQAKPSFTGHFGNVHSVCWDHTGNFLVSVSKDQTTRVYSEQKATGQYNEVSRAQIHGYDINSVTLIKLKEGCLDLIASGADEKVIRVIEPPASVANLINFSTKSNLHLFFENAEQESKYLTGNKEVVEYTATTEGGTQVLGLMTKVQKVERQKISTYYEQQEEEVVEEKKEIGGTTVSSQDYSKIQTEDYLVKHTLWPEMNKLYGHPYEIVCVTSNGNGLMASSCLSLNRQSAFVLIWDTKQWKIKQTIYHHNNTVNDIRFSKDGKLLLTVSKDRTYAVYGNDFKILYNQQAHTRAIMNGDFSFDSKFVITASRDKSIKIHSIENQKTVAEIKLKKPVFSVAFAPASYIFAAGCEDGSLYFFKFQDQKIEELYKVEDYLGHSGVVNRLCWTEKAGELLLATCSKDHSVRVYAVTQ